MMSVIIVAALCGLSFYIGTVSQQKVTKRRLDLFFEALMTEGVSIDVLRRAMRRIGFREGN